MSVFSALGDMAQAYGLKKRLDYQDRMRKEEEEEEEQKRLDRDRARAQLMTDIATGRPYAPEVEGREYGMDDYISGGDVLSIPEYDPNVMAPVGPGGGPMREQDISVPGTFARRGDTIPYTQFGQIAGLPSYQQLMETSPESLPGLIGMGQGEVQRNVAAREGRQAGIEAQRGAQGQEQALRGFVEEHLPNLAPMLDLGYAPSRGAVEGALQPPEQETALGMAGERASNSQQWAELILPELFQNPEMTVDDFLANLEQYGGAYDYNEVAEGFEMAQMIMQQQMAPQYTGGGGDVRQTTAPPQQAPMPKYRSKKNVLEDAAWDIADMSYSSLMSKAEAEEKQAVKAKEDRYEDAPTTDYREKLEAVRERQFGQTWGSTDEFFETMAPRQRAKPLPESLDMGYKPEFNAPRMEEPVGAVLPTPTEGEMPDDPVFEKLIEKIMEREGLDRAQAEIKALEIWNAE